MTTAQKTLLSCSAVCYVLVLYSFFHSALWMILLFFILHSISLLYFAYLSYTTSQAPQLEEELAELKEQYSRLVQENTRLSDELTAAGKKYEELETVHEELAASAALAQQASTAESESIRHSGYADFLPPLSDHSGSREPIDIIQVARDTIQELLPSAQKAGIQIHVSSASDTLLVKADTQRIRILFRNIIDNSIKYMNRAGNLVITMSTVGDDIFIVLKDNGNGLSEAETPHIFEMNYQGSNRISGNGLGLTQAKAIVDSYGGTIYAKSTIGKGMGIYIQIPID